MNFILTGPSAATAAVPPLAPADPLPRLRGRVREGNRHAAAIVSRTAAARLLSTSELLKRSTR